MLRLLGQLQSEAADNVPPEAAMPESMSVAAWIMIAVILLGLPLLVREVLAIYRRRGLGLPVDRAWPPVYWGGGPVGALGIAYLAVMLHIAVAMAIMGVASLWFDIRAMSQTQQTVAAMAIGSVIWIVMLGFLIVWTGRIQRAPLAALGFSLPDVAASVGAAGRILLASMPLILALSVFSQYIYYRATGEYSDAHSILQAVSPTEERPGLLLLAGIFFMTTFVIPFFEELFYRGFIQNTLLRLGRPWLAITLSSVIFAATHLSNADGLVSFLPLMALSLGLGYAFYRTRSLLTCWLMHMAFNGFNLIMAMMQG